MNLDEHLRAVGIYHNQQLIVQDLDRLILKGFPLVKILLLGPSDLEVKGENSLFLGRLIEQNKIGTITGTTTGLTKGFFLGNLAGSTVGVLLGLGLLCLPGLGQIALSSAMIFTLISGGICTVTGGIIGSFIGLGLSEGQVKEYQNLISQGKFLIVIKGTKEEIAYAEDILKVQKGQKSL